jgi:hypothetical protein
MRARSGIFRNAGGKLVNIRLMEPNSTGFQSVDLCVEPREIIFPRLVVVVNSPYECQQWGKNPPNKEDYEVSQNLMHANLSITDGVYGMVSDDDVGVRINGMRQSGMPSDLQV